METFDINGNAIHPRFMGYSLYQRVDDLLAGLVLDGFSFDDEEDNTNNMSNGCLVFKGPFWGETVKLAVYFREDHIVTSIMVLFDVSSTLWVLATTLYGLTQMKVEARYGKPIHSVREFQFPFEEGDGNEIGAFATNKARYADVYDVEGGMVTMFISTNQNGFQVAVSMSDSHTSD